MRNGQLGSIMLALALVAVGSEGADAGEIRPADPRVHPAAVMRVIPLGDGARLVIRRDKSSEANGMTAVVLEGGHAFPLRATDGLPRSVVRDGNAGQIFSAALLDDGRLALATGWTNRSGRNINGISLLRRGDAGWKVDRTIVLAGAVRDLAPGPDGGFFAVTAERIGHDRARLEIVVVGNNGSIRGTVESRELALDDAFDLASRLRLRRVGDGRLASVDLDGGVVRVFTVEPAGACEATTIRHDGEPLYYPKSRGTCFVARLTRLLAVGEPPNDTFGPGVTVAPEMARLNDDHSLTVLWTGYDGSVVRHLAVTHGNAGRTVAIDVPLAGGTIVLEEKAVEGVTIAEDPRLVRIATR